MADTVRTVIYLTAEAAALLEKRTTPRKRGVYVSELIDNDRGPALPGQGVSERIEAKLDRVIELMGRA